MATNGIATSYSKKLVSADFYCNVVFTDITE
nr:MAG TPA: Lsm2-8 spliceosome U6 Prp24-8 spliceosome U6 Prp24, SPLICING [Caudoviricetes sp.]